MAALAAVLLLVKRHEYDSVPVKQETFRPGWPGWPGKPVYPALVTLAVLAAMSALSSVHPG